MKINELQIYENIEENFLEQESIANEFEYEFMIDSVISEEH